MAQILSQNCSVCSSNERQNWSLGPAATLDARKRYSSAKGTLRKLGISSASCGLGLTKSKAWSVLPLHLHPSPAPRRASPAPAPFASAELPRERLAASEEGATTHWGSGSPCIGSGRLRPTEPPCLLVAAPLKPALQAVRDRFIMLEGAKLRVP